MHCDCPPQILEPRPLSPARRRTLNAAKFWALMERWGIPTDRALQLIGQRRQGSSERRLNFSLSERQAQVLSCLLEIDLTLTLAAIEGADHRCRGASPELSEAVLPETLGSSDPKQAATVLWSLQGRTRRPKGLEVRSAA